MLDNQSGFQSSDKEVVRAALANLGATRFNVHDGSENYFYKIRVARQNELTVVTSSCTSATETAYEPATFVRQYFSLASACSLRFTIDGKSEELSKSSSSIIVPSDRSLHAASMVNHHLLVLRIESSALRNKLQAMLGIDIPGDIEFSGPLVSDGPAQHGMRLAVVQFASDLEFWGPSMVSGVRSELEQALIVRFLLCSQHNFSARLVSEPAAPSSAQLRRVADYIEANWDKSLDIETLSATFDVSARSLFRHFKKYRDSTPQDYIKSVRLKNVRAILQSADENMSVMSVAMKCGFQSLGHFARDYRAAFGELPSETVRRVRKSLRH